jgi:hypothetical protein
VNRGRFRFRSRFQRAQSGFLLCRWFVLQDRQEHWFVLLARREHWFVFRVRRDQVRQATLLLIGMDGARAFAKGRLDLGGEALGVRLLHAEAQGSKVVLCKNDGPDAWLKRLPVAVGAGRTLPATDGARFARCTRGLASSGLVTRNDQPLSMLHRCGERVHVPVLAPLEAHYAVAELAAEQAGHGLEQLSTVLRRQLHQQDRQRLRQLKDEYD